MDVRLLLILFFLASCMPQAQVSSGRLSEESGATGGTSGGAIPNSDTGFNYLGKISKSITINVSNLNGAYIVGANVESFLKISGNFEQDYCLVSRFIIGGTTKEMRSKIVPVSYYDFTAKRTVRVMRIDFPETSSSRDICGTATLQVLNAQGVLAPESITYSVVHEPKDICTTCTSVLGSYKNTVFLKNSSTSKLQELSLAQLDIRALNISVDPNNNTANNPGSCTISECVSRGYDCCLDNQCVKDGATKPSAQTQYNAQWQAAELEKLQNPMAYLKYPHLYYVCGTTVPSTGGAAGGTTGGSSGGTGGYDEAFAKLKKDYYCIQNLKNNKVSETFHLDLQTNPTPFPHVTTPDKECYTTSMTSDTMYYKTVVERLYKTCGCAKTNLPDMINFCPAYDYAVTTADALGAPIRIDCYTPSTGGGQVPVSQNVSVNSRSAPHRFFDSVNGTERALPTTNYSQEGDTFEYLDSEYLLPNQSDNFGMNSILGQMSVALDRALPAKTVTVELDQVYILSTTSGYYTPCPTCSKDSWLPTFTAFPTTAYGVGLQAVGHSTARDEFGNNNTAGNYEDTIFGRACWLPPTMIPFSHLPTSLVSNSYSDPIQKQRMNRLKTQAALFANGYQRDWFGFNKGALIGSFDGVTWFAIGKGRIVKSTTKKLFLAINAPFADIATPTIHVVNVSQYDGITQAAQVDYDPQYSLSHPYQNEAGNCQATHLCATDTDCVTKLGWEYMCADVRDVKTNWPSFDAEGKERANVSTNLTIDQILQQKRFPSSSTKRCVYRGAGAPCIVNSANIADANKRKTMTCAPNFYCAGVNAGNVFNGKIARYGGNIEDIPVSRNHTFGKDANVLGRPLSYVASNLSTSLSSDIQTSIKTNLQAYDSNGLNDSGICQPGKLLPVAATQATAFSPYVQHQSRDISGRTDFINQIASCNPTLFTDYRYTSCPVIGSDGNYDIFSSSTWSTTHVAKSKAQNSCGLDSLFTNVGLSGTADSLRESSPFKNIEAKTLASTTVNTPTFARDACLRRAGQVCHTDLDCGPNKLHAEQADIYSVNYFGNTAEKQYYMESLICGQTNPKPSIADIVAYRAFNMNENRCCREQGLDLTTFTSDVPKNTKAQTAADYIAATFDLRSWISPGSDPDNALRYSRLSSVEGLTAPDLVISTTTKPPLSAYQSRDGFFAGKRRTSSIGTAVGSALGPGINVLTKNQWSTLGSANSNTCCGGGWVRKFSDGSTDWTRRDRVYLDVGNFRCLNARTALISNPTEVQTAYTSNVSSLVNVDYGDYCKDNTGANSSCAMNTFANTTNYYGPVAALYETFRIATVDPAFNTTNREYYFMPNSGDNNPAVIIDYALINGRRNINLKIPSFVPQTNSNLAFDELYALGTLVVDMLDYPNTQNRVACSRFAAMGATTEFTSSVPAGSCGGSNCCYHYEPTSRIFRVIHTSNATPAAWANKQVGIQVINSFNSAGRVAGINRNIPGSNTYYSKNLGLLELSGIPQITYEPLYCSDVSTRLVPGLFKANADQLTMVTKTDFENTTTFSFIDPNTMTYKTNQHGLDHTPVFAENDFKCCAQLGKVTTNKDKCCSGYGITSGNKVTCALPAGADLMVYFNRFVSNDGRGTTQPGGGLVDADFSSDTGEPLITAAVNQKISALGVAYCETGAVRQGGAFGSFPLEPVGNSTSASDRIYSIVDSSSDIGQISNAGQTVPVGYNAFMSGFRWNHHLYCID